MTFEDHFSKGAAEYASYRPQYPSELYDYLASIAPGHQLAWDCGAGSGQAALGLTRRFDRVIATDASAEQLAHAVAHPQIEYRVERAEAVSLSDASADLVAVALAVHWFDFDAFYQEVRRVLKPGGIIAVWTYHLPVIERAVDHVIGQYYSELLAGYWPERIRYLAERYTTLPFPFDEVKPPPFEVRADWTLSQLAGFMGTWSGSRRYQEANGQHPLSLIWEPMLAAWGDPNQPRPVRWPLHLRVGRV